MKCTVCYRETVLKTVEGVEIDLCVNCGGIWLDGGELEALTGHDLKNYRQLMCPKCSLIMLTRTIGNVEVDHCFKCGGTWLDKGELKAISEITNEDGSIKEEINKFSSGVGHTRNVEIAKNSINKHVELKDGMVDEVFVMYKDGLLITCSQKNAEEEGVNEDILAGTLMTIQDFIEVSFGKMGASGLKEIKFGDREILIERGENIITAVVASGDVPPNFNEYVQDVIRQIEDRYKNSLSDWDGNLSDLVGVQEMLTSLMQESDKKEGAEVPAGDQPQAETPAEGTPAQGETPAEGSEPQAETPAEGSEPQAETPAESSEPQAESESPAEGSEPQAESETPAEGSEPKEAESEPQQE